MMSTLSLQITSRLKTSGSVL